MESTQDDADVPRASETEDNKPYLLKLEESLDAMPGRRVNAQIAQLRRIRGIFEKNVSEFQQHLDQMKDISTSLRLLDVRNQVEYDAFLNEMERLLHNVVASISSRVDLQRWLVSREWSDANTSWNGELEARKNWFVTDGASQFLKNLRNYMLHYKLPVSFGSYNLWGDGSDYALILSAPELLKAKDAWKAPGRAWLQKSDPDINIGVIIANYLAKTSEFDNWLEQSVIEANAQALIEYQAAVKVFNEEHARVFGP